MKKSASFYLVMLNSFQHLTNVLGFLSIPDTYNKNTAPSMTSVKNYNSPKTSLFSGPFIQIFKMKSFKKQAAFSLVELLMALLVASLLMAALAPVMTKKFNENVNVTGNMNPAGTTKVIHVIDYDSTECDEIKTDTDGSTYCEGEFMVPAGYNGIIKATVIGAGGGGGTAPTAGYTEYTTVSNSHKFTVPSMVNKIEATLVSGGGGGGIDSSAKSLTFVTYGSGNVTKDKYNDVTVQSTGTGTWTIPLNSRGRDMIATACGGGGGGGSTGNSAGLYYSYSGNGFGGGSGGYIQNRIINFGNASNFTYYIGGGGSSGMITGGSLDMTGGEAAKPYGGGGILRFAPSVGGGQGGDTFTYPLSGVYKTSTEAGGAGGIGGPYGKQNTCPCTNIPNPNKVIYLKGGDGGQPGGGGGAICHYCNCVSSGGGGGGGASQLVTGSNNIVLNAPGGGGGGGSVRQANLHNDNTCCAKGDAGAGGGGGGTGGGAGGGVNSGAGKGGTNGKDASGYTGGSLSTIFGSDYCNGGAGGVYTGVQTGYSGRSGVIKLSYIDYDTSKGKGGASGSTILNSIINAAPNETLTISTGSGGAGGASAYINKSGTTGNLVQKVEPTLGNETMLKRASTILINTGKSAANNSVSKNGGSLSVFNGDISCTGGTGGTPSNPNATAPTTGYGCGGGAGYMEGNGANGGGGYARISWNKYWDNSANEYRVANIGAAGGGASGNTFTYSIPVKSNEIIKVRIGKGGNGGFVLNNNVINSKKGGDTAFGDIKAGGGYGGNSPSINSSNVLTNGTGGSISNVCHFKNTSYFSKASYCKKGLKGADAVDVKGGIGGNFTPLKYDEEKTVTGTGGTGGQIDTGDNSNGKAGTGIASGGGGASIRDLGRVDSSSQSNITNNQTKGGNGANGKIILEWWR